MSNSEINSAKRLLDEVMIRDRFALRRDLNRIKQNFSADQLATWLEKANQSSQKRQLRADSLPQIQLDESLPIFHRAEEIAQAIQDHQVIVVSGATGSGKSTQLPLIAMQAGFGVRGLIGHTQPRRIAARGVAARIASQLSTKLGQLVGYKMRFVDETNPKTLVKLMTDGILLAETQTDRFLDAYDLIIVDEAHERSLNIDFLLGYLKRTLNKRPDFRLIITSATIDTQRFAEHFTLPGQTPVPIIDVEGRTFPVEIVYREAESELSEKELHDQIIQACKELATFDRGDILVFLPTEHDIRNVAKKLRPVHFSGDANSQATEILPLYARLTTDQQNRIFQPGKGRRIVLATNVAESSITVPGIKYVVDTGTARISRYAPRSKVQRLPIEPVSQASADQRAGRCGRVEPGVCIRLYTQDDFDGRPKFTTPEIRRTNLASVILQTLSLKLGKVEEFPFIDPPRPEMIRDGYKTLFELGAVDEARNLTRLGKKLSRLPVDPRIGRLLFEADENGCLADVLIIAAALEVQDPRQRPLEKQQAADTAHEQFADANSDFISILKLWDFFQDQKEKLSNSKLRKCCVTNFLSFSMMQQWRDVYRQLRRLAKDARLNIGERRNDYNAIHKSLLAGYLSGIALLEDRFEYTGPGGIKFHLWPGSGVFASKPKWVIVSEIVETTKRYGRCVAKISPEWIEPLAKHLVKRKHVDPFYSSKKQTVMAYENVTLYGLPIVSRRRVGYTKINPEESRRLFIDHGLVEGQLRANHAFYQANQSLRQSIQDIADKTRDRTMVVDDFRIAQFYDERLPLDAVDHVSLLQLLKNNDELNSRLKMEQTDLLPESGDSQLSDQFPDQVLVGNIEVPVEYRFAPGEQDDGPSITIPVEGVGQVDDLQAGWLVPGLIPGRIEALIRSLPKATRRNLIPAPETAKKVTASLNFGVGSFLDAVARELSKLAPEPVLPEMFDSSKVQSHLQVNMKVVDGDEVIAQGRSLAELKEQLGTEHLTNEIALDDSSWNQDDLKDWTWDELPELVEIKRGKTVVPCFVAIMDQGDSVGLRLLDSKAACKKQTTKGLVRLYTLKHRRHVKSQVKWLPDFDQTAVYINRVINASDLKIGLADLIVRVGMVEGNKPPKNRVEFEQRCENAIEQISIATQEVARWLPKFGKAAHDVFKTMEGFPNKFFHTKTDLKLQMKHLFCEDFLTTPWKWLQNFPRYLQAIAMRVDKVASNAKEESSIQEVSHYWDLYSSMQERHQQHSITDPEIEHFRWMIEEYRVSLFAQQLGTFIPVSAKRLEKQWAKVQKI